MKSLALLNLAAGFIVCLLVMAKFVPPWAQAGYKLAVPMENWSTLTLKDPQLGSKIHSIPEDRFQRALLVIGDCGPCNESKVMAFSAMELAKELKRVVLVSSTIPLDEAKRRFGAFNNIEVGILSEPQKQELNVSFLPRVYLIDQGNRLTFIQPPSFSYGQAFWTIQKGVTLR